MCLNPYYKTNAVLNIVFDVSLDGSNQKFQAFGSKHILTQAHAIKETGLVVQQYCTFPKCMERQMEENPELGLQPVKMEICVQKGSKVTTC